ncbi:noggin-2-like [Petromyzon marinus]|uniref:Noggin n=1 Tax=Petromyzon marinus TaxID=7757 RepID=S4S1H9_PETMA|nr:noggin C [Petromyzon marinus]
MEQSQCLFVACFFLFFMRNHQGLCQHYFHLRPVPSENLPVIDLVEDPDPELDPKAKDLDERALLKKLGSNFDHNFMSIATPESERQPGGESTTTTTTTTTAAVTAADRKPKPTGPIPSDIKRLDLTETLYGQKLKLGKRARRKFLQWLWAHTACPVVYSWKELNVRFWPRYIKEGSCYSARSCSVPEGMVCKPVKFSNKTFLRWHCQGWGRQRFCTWIPIQYPVLTECKCSC